MHDDLCSQVVDGPAGIRRLMPPGKPEVLPAFMSAQVEDARRFYVPRDLLSGGLQVVSGGWERCAQDYCIRRHEFAHPTVELVVGGRGWLQMGRETVALHRGVMFSYGPKVAHELTTHPVEHLEKFFVNMSGATAQALLQEAGMRPGRILTLSAVEEVQGVFDQLITAGQRGTANAARIAALHARILMLMVAEAQLPHGQRASGARETFLKCRAYLEANYLRLRTVEEAAAACGVTQAYFSRIFTRFASQSAYQFLLRLKMGHAAVLLEHRGLNVAETADVLEMDPFHFSRTFKRMHGRAPSSFIPRR